MEYSKAKTKKEKEEDTPEPTQDKSLDSESHPPIILLAPPKDDAPKLRMLSLFGTLDEDKVTDLVQGLFALHQYGAEEIYEDPEDPLSPVKEVIYKPIDFNI